MVMAMRNPIAPLRYTDHMMDLGTVRPASSTSSAEFGVSINAGYERCGAQTHVDRTVEST